MTSSRIQGLDREQLKQAYNQLPEKISTMDGEALVDSIAYRIYVEFSNALQQRYGRTDESEALEYSQYDGDAYTHWRNDEIHYALEREGGPADSAKYCKMRTRIMEAIVARAVQLFKDWNSTCPGYDSPDKRNLRADLRPYLDIKTAPTPTRSIHFMDQMFAAP